MRIYLDMDGVLCDFVGGVYKLTNFKGVHPKGEYDICKVVGCNIWPLLEEQGEDFWMNLEPTPEAEKLMSIVKDQDYYIATSPTLDPYSASGKMHWLTMNYPQARRRFFITPHKHLLARQGDVLVDDSDDQILKWRGAGGMGITMPRVWNQFHSDAPSMAAGLLEHLL